MPVTDTQVTDALRRVKYPGFSRDIVSFGLVKNVAVSDGSVTVQLALATNDPDIPRTIKADAETALRELADVREAKVLIDIHAPPAGAGTAAGAGTTRIDGVKHVIAVASGKGGVGKSTVAANLAAALSRIGYKVGLLDADIYGPSVPMMFGTGDERPRGASGQSFYPVERFGVKLVSIGFFLNDKAPVIWRGPMVMGAVRQFLKDTLWGTQDFLIVDLPPGTGDAQLTLAQQVALDGAVIVTTPQDVALLDATRAARMLQQLHCPVIGVVENMSYFVCPDCGERDELFGAGGGAKLALAEGTRVLAQIPIHLEVREAGDAGMPIVLKDAEHPASRAFMDLARGVLAAMPED
jgi:ATP-binding protein involved in chromosome partitioning